jgi:hypothetical protein
MTKSASTVAVLIVGCHPEMSIPFMLAKTGVIVLARIVRVASTDIINFLMYYTSFIHSAVIAASSYNSFLII